MLSIPIKAFEEEAATGVAGLECTGGAEGTGPEEA